MDKTFLQEAFKALDILNEEDFNLSSSEDIEDLKSFTDEDTSIMDIDIIDPDVTEEDELQDDYVGKVILDCDVCHSKIYKDPTQIVFSDDSEVVNIEDECPFCYSNDGYKIIGMVSAFDKADIDNTVDVEDNIETDDTVEIEDEENMDEGILGTVGGIFGGPLGAIGGSIADGVISKVNSSKKNESLDDTNCKDEGCKDGKCEDMDELPPRNRERVKRKSYKNTEPVVSDETKQIKDIDEGCNKKMQRRKLRKNVKEGFNNVSIETDDQILDMNTEDNGKVTVTTEPKRNKETQKEIITPVSDDIQSKINPELEVDAEEEIDVNPEEFDERSFDRIGESYLKEHYSNIKSLKTSNVTINGNKMIVECVITFTSNNKKKTKFIFESHSINKRGRVKFIGKNKQLNANEQFTLIGRLRNNTLINESLTTNIARKPLRRKSITEGKEIFHNDNGVDYTVIERSVSGKNALLNKGKQWIVAWDCPETNEGSWGQGHYFFDENEARRVWKDKYLNENYRPLRRTRRRTKNESYELRRRLRRNRLGR